MGLNYSKHPLHNSRLTNNEENLHNKKNIGKITDNLENIENTNIPKTHQRNLSINYKYLIHSSLKKKNESIKHQYLEEQMHSNVLQSKDIKYKKPDIPNMITERQLDDVYRKNSCSSNTSSSNSNISSGSNDTPNRNNSNNTYSYDTSEIISARQNSMNTSQYNSSSPLKTMLEDSIKKDNFIMGEMKVLGIDDTTIHCNKNEIHSQISKDLHSKKKLSNKKYNKHKNNHIKSKTIIESPCLFGKSLYTF